MIHKSLLLNPKAPIKAFRQELVPGQVPARGGQVGVHSGRSSIAATSAAPMANLLNQLFICSRTHIFSCCEEAKSQACDSIPSLAIDFTRSQRSTST